MFRLFQAGVLAACIQFAAVAVATLIVILSARHGLIIIAPPSASSTSDSPAIAVVPLLKWIYLLTAFAAAMSSHASVDCTAARIRQASRSIRPTEPDLATKILLSHLWVAAIGFAILTLRSPPESLVEAGRYWGCSCAASILWSGTMSIGIASFGANAQAASKAL